MSYTTVYETCVITLYILWLCEKESFLTVLSSIYNISAPCRYNIYSARRALWAWFYGAIKWPFSMLHIEKDMKYIHYIDTKIIYHRSSYFSYSQITSMTIIYILIFESLRHIVLISFWYLFNMVLWFKLTVHEAP